MLFEPLVRAAPADSPTAMLSSTIVRFESADVPIAELRDPFVRLVSPEWPKVEFSVPIDRVVSACVPSAVLENPDAVPGPAGFPRNRLPFVPSSLKEPRNAAFWK